MKNQRKNMKKLPLAAIWVKDKIGTYHPSCDYIPQSYRCQFGSQPILFLVCPLTNLVFFLFLFVFFFFLCFPVFFYFWDQDSGWDIHC